MDLSEIRQQINEIDEQLVALFKKRMETVVEVAKYKQENHLPVLDRTRERQVLCRVAEMAGEDLEHYAKVLYTTLMDVSRNYQRNFLDIGSPLAGVIGEAVEKTPSKFPTRAMVACQGTEGAYSQQACDQIFDFANIMYFETFDAVFNAVEKGMCRYGILPIENSSAGSVAQVYDLMEKHNFHIVRAVRQRIDHVLLGKRGTKLEDVKEIYSHPQAIAQCSEFLKAHPKIKVHEYANTAMAAKMVAESDRSDVAAIASRACGDLYDLVTLSASVSNSDSNYTRFICISRDLEIYPGANKISMTLSLPHQPGSLYGMLSRFAAMGMNLTKLESRPVPGSEFEFRFHFDIMASVTEPEVVKLLCELDEGTERFVFLGNYQEM